MSEQDDNFLSRWSRRKAQVQQVQQGVPAAAADPVVVVPFPVPTANPVLPLQPKAEAAVGVAAPVALAPSSAAAADATAGLTQQPAQPQPQAPPKPTLEDVEALTPESDFSRFIARDVDEKVKNSAMKKLFSDPHYNVMDGLDTYIDDYNTPVPLPKAMLRQLMQARMLGLLDDELPEQPAAEETARAAAAADVATRADEAAEVSAEQAAAVDGEGLATAGPTAAEPKAEAAAAAPADPIAAAEPQPAAGSASSAS